MPVIFGIELADLIWPAVVVGGGYVAVKGAMGVADGAQQGVQDATKNITSNLATLLLVGGAALLLIGALKNA